MIFILGCYYIMSVVSSTVDNATHLLDKIISEFKLDIFKVEDSIIDINGNERMENIVNQKMNIINSFDSSFTVDNINQKSALIYISVLYCLDENFHKYLDSIIPNVNTILEPLFVGIITYLKLQNNDYIKNIIKILKTVTVTKKTLKGGANFNIMFLCAVSFMYSLIQVKAISINPAFITQFNSFKHNPDLQQIQNFVNNIDNTNSIQNLKTLTDGLDDRNNKIMNIGSKIVDTIDTLKILDNNNFFKFIQLLKNIGGNIKSIIQQEYESSFQNNISFFKNVCDLGLLSGTALNKNLPLILETGSTAASYANIFLSLKLIADINSDALGEYAKFTNIEKVDLLNRLFGGRSKRRNRRSKKNRYSKRKNRKSSTRYRM